MRVQAFGRSAPFPATSESFFTQAQQYRPYCILQLTGLLAGAGTILLLHEVLE